MKRKLLSKKQIVRKILKNVYQFFLSFTLAAKMFMLLELQSSLQKSDWFLEKLRQVSLNEVFYCAFV